MRFIMKIHNKIRLIIFLSILPILASYSHSSYAAEVTVYKCQAAKSQRVRFQDTPCSTNEHIQAKSYAFNEAITNGLRAGEVAALEQMHTRQNLERVEQIRTRDMQRERDALEARENSRKTERSFIIINNNATYKPQKNSVYNRQKSTAKQFGGFSIKLQYKN